MKVVTLDLEDIFHFFLNGAGINTSCKGVVTTTLSPLALLTLRTFLLVILVLFWVGGGSLLSKKWLLLTKCVSRGRVSRLILSKVFLLLLYGPVPSGASWVHIAGAGRWLEHYVYFCIDGFLNNLFPRVQFPALDIQLGPNARSKAFPEISDHNLLV